MKEVIHKYEPYLWGGSIGTSSLLFHKEIILEVTAGLILAVLGTIVAHFIKRYLTKKWP